MGRTSGPSLENKAAEYLAAKSTHEIERLTGLRGQAPPRRKTRARVLRAYRHWQPWELELLGKLPDAEVARQTERKLQAVTEKRRAIGLAYTLTDAKRWTDEELALLGTAKDSIIAKLDRTVESIKTQRRKKGVPNYRQIHFWTKAEDKVVMSYPYKEAARRLNRTMMEIETRRRALRAGNTGKPARAWTAREIALLGKHTDTELARKLKRSRSTVVWKRRSLRIPAMGDYSRPWTPEEDQWLGTQPDAQLAPILKRGLKAIQHRRLKLGILFRLFRIQ